ncbi:MAG: methyltransferase domain-containing protein [Methylococcales bacterium]
MGMIGGKIGYRILKYIAPRSKSSTRSAANEALGTKTEQFFGDTFFKDIEGKTVIDFGCGSGNQSIEIAQQGAAKVIGVDIQKHRLEIGKQTAKQLGINDRCVFTTITHELGDIVISKDAFEHFADPAKILQIMASLLKPEGYVLAAFGPTWLHPYGGHLFSVFPWSHLMFTEASQIRWRSDFKTDGATRFSEIEGGLNQLTIARFEQIVTDSPLRLEWLETIPIRGIALLKTKALREIGSSIVRCKLSLE